MADINLEKASGKNKSSDTGSSSSSDNSDTGYDYSQNDHVWMNDAESDELYSEASHENTKGTGWSNGIGSGDELKATDYDNGFVHIKDKNGNDLGWIERDKLNKWNDTASYDTGGRTPDDLPDEGAGIIVHKKEKILNEQETEDWSNAIKTINNLDEAFSYIKNSGGLITQLASSYANPNNFTPFALGTDLNGLTNGITNNTTDNSISQPISMDVKIINEKGAEPYTDQKLFKAMDRWQREQSRRFR
jgi:hypothetical protein